MTKKNNKQLFGPNFCKTSSTMTDRHLDIFRFFLGIFSCRIIQDVLTILLIVLKLVKINK